MCLNNWIVGNTVKKRKSISVRREPTQNRSQKRVDEIYAATRRLLRKHGATGFSKVSTTQIAREANISVGSLYQYFPNRDAIIFSLSTEILEEIRSKADEFYSDQHLTLSRHVFFEKLYANFLSTEDSTGLDRGLVEASLAIPEVQEVFVEHANLVNLQIAKYIKHYGSTWSIKRLHRLALFSYFIHSGAKAYREEFGLGDKEALEWGKDIFLFLIERCFTNR